MKTIRRNTQKFNQVLECDFVATWHPVNSDKMQISCKAEVLREMENNKNWKLQEEIANDTYRLLFPHGGYYKIEVL